MIEPAAIDALVAHYVEYDGEDIVEIHHSPDDAEARLIIVSSDVDEIDEMLPFRIVVRSSEIDLPTVTLLQLSPGAWEKIVSCSSSLPDGWSKDELVCVHRSENTVRRKVE